MRVFVCALIACVLGMNTSCTKEDGVLVTGDTTSLTVKLAGDNESKAVGAPTSSEENAVKNFTVYVFYPGGPLEKSATATGSTTTIIDGLTTGDKRIAVVANVPAGFANITNYSQFASAMFDLDTQDPAGIEANGLAMSGEMVKTLVGGNENSANLKISRVVAKVELLSIDIDAEAGHDPALFELVAVHIMKARATSNMGLPEILTGNAFYGGTIGTVSTTQKGYLAETITLSDNENRYFYVFPNGDTDATLLTIEGKYNGVTTYFPFRINEKAIEDQPGSGEYIKRNTRHRIAVTLKRLNGGTTDPEQPADPASLTVTITPQDWVLIPTQNVEW